MACGSPWQPGGGSPGRLGGCSPFSCIPRRLTSAGPRVSTKTTVRAIMGSSRVRFRSVQFMMGTYRGEEAQGKQGAAEAHGGHAAAGSGSRRQAVMEAVFPQRGRSSAAAWRPGTVVIGEKAGLNGAVALRLSLRLGSAPGPSCSSHTAAGFVQDDDAAAVKFLVPSMLFLG